MFCVLFFLLYIYILNWTEEKKETKMLIQVIEKKERKKLTKGAACRSSSILIFISIPLVSIYYIHKYIKCVWIKLKKKQLRLSSSTCDLRDISLPKNVSFACIIGDMNYHVCPH